MESSIDYPVTLLFSRDDPTNTTIEENGRIVYTVETSRKTKPGSTHAEELITTLVFDHEQNLLAQLDWNDTFSDVVTMRSRDMQKMALSKWIKKSLLPVNRTATFKDYMGRTYKWDKKGYKRQYQLFAVDVSAKDPVAWFERAQPYVYAGNPVPTPSRLHFSSRADEIRDDVVLSFLFLEKDRRAGTALSSRGQLDGDAVQARV